MRARFVIPEAIHQRLTPAGVEPSRQSGRCPHGGGRWQRAVGRDRAQGLGGRGLKFGRLIGKHGALDYERAQSTIALRVPRHPMPAIVAKAGGELECSDIAHLTRLQAHRRAPRT